MKFISPYLIVAIILLVSLTSCQNSEKSFNDEPVDELLANERDYELEKENSELDKLFIIEGKAVIFFFLSKTELKELSKELGNSYRYETDFLFNNYKQQAKKFKKLLAKHNVQSELIRNKKFLIKLKNGQTFSFNRIHEDQIMGEIISDGIHDPIIEYGMFSNKELAALLKRYFQIENLGFIEQEDLPLELPVEEKMESDSIEQIIEH